jgi:predicted DCC family thiol-disulfide oxidoreductase YuxK
VKTQGKTSSPERNPSVILFDGLCNACNAAVDFVLARDRRGEFRFAPLQSAAARRLLEGHPLDPADLESVVLIEEGRVFTRSSAILRILGRLGGGWTVLGALALIPRSVRDRFYRWFARNRYRWFGRRDACRLPPPEAGNRFIDS